MLDLRVQCREWAQSGFGWDGYRQTVLTSCILHGRLAFSTPSAVSPPTPMNEPFILAFACSSNVGKTGL